MNHLIPNLYKCYSMNAIFMDNTIILLFVPLENGRGWMGRKKEDNERKLFIFKLVTFDFHPKLV